jgi:hypothetical protein
MISRRTVILASLAAIVAIGSAGRLATNGVGLASTPVAASQTPK